MLIPSMQWRAYWATHGENGPPRTVTWCLKTYPLYLPCSKRCDESQCPKAKSLDWRCFTSHCFTLQVVLSLYDYYSFLFSAELLDTNCACVSTSADTSCRLRITREQGRAVESESWDNLWLCTKSLTRHFVLLSEYIVTIAAPSTVNSKYSIRHHEK